jgi:hypothetical protein
VCHQTVSLIARHLEANGIATMCMASALDIIQAGNPPRTTFLDYPLGHSAGKPFDAEDQLAVVRAAVLGLENASRHDGIQMLPNSWSTDQSWLQEAADSSKGDSRQPRDETPRFQSEEDRKLAVASGALA